MNFHDYQNLARRTQNAELTKHERLFHALTGLCAEVGEIHSIYQKAYQGHPVDIAKVTDEMSDVIWFLSELADVIGVRLDDVALHNIEKLRKRYPTGFSAERSVNRDE